MKIKFLICLIRIITGVIILNIPNYVANSLYDSPYVGDYLVTVFILKCVFLLLGIGFISYAICYFLNKLDQANS